MQHTDFLPITKEVLRDYYQSHPCPSVPSNVKAAENNINRAINKIVTLFKDQSLVPPEETEASPEKTEHNVLMSCCALEEIEELLTKLQASSQIAKTSAESITASCLQCRGVLQRYKAETEKRTEELIRSFLGNDLRMKAVDAHRTLSAHRRQKSLSVITDIRERYDKQWEHEAQQREWLSTAAAGNGAVSSIANAIVPPALLALGKTLNDEHGPMEEYRTAYGPRVKSITARLRKARRAVDVVVAFDISQPNSESVISALATLDTGIKTICNDVCDFYEKLLPITVNAPMFLSKSDANEISETVVVSRNYTVQMNVQKGEEVEWSFTTNNTIKFSVEFVPKDESKPKETIKPLIMCNSHQTEEKGSAKSKEVGAFVFFWDNSFSWLHNKNLTFVVKRVAKQ